MHSKCSSSRRRRKSKSTPTVESVELAQENIGLSRFQGDLLPPQRNTRAFQFMLLEFHEETKSLSTDFKRHLDNWTPISGTAAAAINSLVLIGF